MNSKLGILSGLVLSLGIAGSTFAAAPQTDTTAPAKTMKTAPAKSTKKSKRTSKKTMAKSSKKIKKTPMTTTPPAS